MIVSKELRLGNYVNYIDDGKPFIVDSISKDGLDVHDDNEDIWIELDQFEPLPLTEEWLVKFWFHKYLDSFYRYKRSAMIEICFFDSGILVANQSTCLSHINHVHQLQNLFHSLTGEELTITEK